MFGDFLKKMGSGGPSPFSQMSNQQRLQALGHAFSGETDDLSKLLSTVRAGGRPVMNGEGQDIGAAFGGILGNAAGPLGAAGQVLNAEGADISAAFGVPAMMARRKFGFGRKK